MVGHTVVQLVEPLHYKLMVGHTVVRLVEPLHYKLMAGHTVVQLVEPLHYKLMVGHTVVQLVEPLHYKLEVRGFDSLRFHRNFSLTYPSALRMTQPLTEMITRNISWGVKAAGA